MSNPLVGIIMGSDSDLDIMSQAAKTLEEFSVPFEVQIISAHRTPEKMAEFASSAEVKGFEVIIAGAGGSAHLPGMTAAYTNLPVIAVPVKREHHGDEAIKSSRAMPPGVPLAVMPNNGARNAALFAVAILALKYPDIARRYVDFRQKQHDEVIAKNLKLLEIGWEEYLNG
jgi:5-(carboxyamino)imidazole ribonucleotide mutase